MIKNKKTYRKIYVFVLAFVLALLFPFISRAETYIEDPNWMPFDPLHPELSIPQPPQSFDWVWTKEGSPYILEENIWIRDGSSLRIEEGVEVVSAPHPEGTRPYQIDADGTFTIEGTKDNPVKLNDVGRMALSNDNFSFRYAELYKTGIMFTLSTSTIDHVTVSYNESDGISILMSNVNISNSIFRGNNTGVASYNNYASSSVNIHNSSFYENEYAVFNENPNILEATNNWWGSPDGPDPGQAYGNTDFDPWLAFDPFAISAPKCCSNVLFIPGLQASRLYKDENSLLGTTTNTLWEPNRNEDVRKMHMDEMGISLDSKIYTKDIIDKAMGLKEIYKSFIETMNSLVEDGFIESWLSFPYDWRKGVYDLIDENMLEKIYALASTSKTGKVIIISHSNGGLVAKALVKKLEELGRADIVDNMIFVAVPELGTPQALLSLLHGYGQSIAGGLILKENTARIFSKNSGGAYGLLPSRKFFEKNPITIVSDLFASSRDIASYESMKNFVLNNVFAKASSTDTSIPILLNSYLMSLSDSFHASIDRWKPASTTKTLSIFGWGLPTSQSIIYEKDKHCNVIKTCDMAVSAVKVRDGDGTVLTESAGEEIDSKLFINLKKLQNGIKGGINHANILESENLLAKIKDIVTQATSTDFSNEEYFSTEKPIDTDKYLVIKIYSPVDIDIYDKNGNHTGLIENPTVGKDMEIFETNIPLSSYDDFGRVKMVEIPYGEDYEILLKGNDVGVFSVDLEVKQSDEVIASSTFSEMPVTPLMNIDFIVATSTPNLEKSVMHMDVDGDGTADLINRTDQFLKSTTTDLIKDLPTYIESMKKVILSLKLGAKVEKTWLNRLDKIIKKIEKKNPEKAQKFVKKLTSKKIKNRRINEFQKKAIIKTFENLLSYLESSY